MRPHCILSSGEAYKLTLASNRLPRNLSVPDVERGLTPTKSAQLKKPHATEKGISQQCFSRTIAVLSQEELEPTYLDAIANRGNHKEAKSWYI